MKLLIAAILLIGFQNVHAESFKSSVFFQTDKDLTELGESTIPCIKNDFEQVIDDEGCTKPEFTVIRYTTENDSTFVIKATVECNEPLSFVARNTTPKHFRLNNFLQVKVKNNVTKKTIVTYDFKNERVVRKY